MSKEMAEQVLSWSISYLCSAVFWSIKVINAQIESQNEELCSNWTFVEILCAKFKMMKFILLKTYMSYS